MEIPFQNKVSVLKGKKKGIYFTKDSSRCTYLTIVYLKADFT